MLDIVQSSRFKKDLKKAIKQGKNLDKLEQAIDLLCSQKSLPPKNLDHKLSGDWGGYRECHLAPDWLMIYKIDTMLNALQLARTGSHAELFE